MTFHTIDGTQVARLRARLGVGFVHVVRQAGVTREYLRGVEQAPSRRISDCALRKLARGIGMDYSDFKRAVTAKQETT